MTHQRISIVTKQLIVVLLAGLLAACAGTRPDIYVPAKMPPPLKLSKRPDVALVLGGGGARGYAHIGVLQVLQNAGVPIDLIVGASAGSVVGSLYADSANAAKVDQIMMNAGFWTFAGVSPSLTGLMRGYRAQRFFLHHMKAHLFSQLKIPFIAATTDILNANTIAISSGPVVPAVVASAAIPGVVNPVKMYGYTLVDGAVANPVPVDIALKYHPKVIIAVNIGKDLPPGLPRLAIGFYDRAYAIMWNRLSRFSLSGADVVIHPPVGQVGTFDIGQRKRMYEVGRAAAQQALPKILRILKAKHIKLVKRRRS